MQYEEYVLRLQWTSENITQKRVCRKREGKVGTLRKHRPQ